MRNNQISKGGLEDLYWKKGLSLSKIGKIFGLKSTNAVTYHMEKFNIPRRPSSRKDYPKKPFSGQLKEKAYLSGLRVGDIHAMKHCRLIATTTTSPKLAQMNMFKDVFGKYSHINEREAKGGFTKKTKKVNCYLQYKEISTL